MEYIRILRAKIPYFRQHQAVAGGVGVGKKRDECQK
jgi:hypothetical protein